ncbi:hypothetical protein [Marivita sp. XM-24bin2]|uniref:hypothetical protein n=1 Tax=unclassified Marivita TaxID=2632480 RepID=UPI0025C6216A|nr:hypothetical protein [Marivita sp. XM-24bin2]
MNLHILVRRFTQLSKAGFFDPAFIEFSQRTADAAQHVLDELGYYAEETVREFSGLLWNVLRFISGSRSNDAPHETQYALRKALSEWVQSDALVSSASLDDLNFYVSLADLWSFIEKTLDRFDTGGYGPLIVQIGSPSVYQHRPVFCIPLFHELGHFIDYHRKITEVTILQNLTPKPTSLPMSDADWQQMCTNHRMEHFADLFGACYCGVATNKSLYSIAPTAVTSFTHPSTASRIQVVNDFLSGTQNPVVDLFQDALANLGLPNLAVRFSEPDVTCFDDVLTCRLRDESELYGLFLSSWNYLEVQLQKRTAPWITDDATTYTIEKTVNDLTEKSLRNFEISERWSDVIANKS